MRPGRIRGIFSDAAGGLRSSTGLEVRVLASLLAIAAGIWLFVRLASEVVGGRARSFDNWALRSLRRADAPGEPIGPAWLAEAARDITALGSTSILLIATALACGYLLLAGKVRLMLLLLAAAASGQFLSSLLKLAIGRDRPDVVPHLTTVATASFPSGHAMLSAVVYLTLGALLARAVARRRERIFILGSAVGISLLTGASRIYLGVHYPTDVVAGWAVGTAWALGWWMLIGSLQRRRTIEPADGQSCQARSTMPSRNIT
jgi:undecaprenyl-diphosphatase